MAVFRPGTLALAILISLISIVFFDLMGLVIKGLSGSYGAAELAAYRNLVGLVPSAIALWMVPAWRPRFGALWIRQWRLGFLRGVVVSFAQLCFYLSLMRMEFATAATISYSTAIFTTAFAVPLLGEKVGWLRWLAVLVGFVGVVMVMGPARTGFDWGALLPLGAAVFYGFSAVAARMMDAEVPSPLVNLYSSGAAAVTAMLLALWSGGFSPIAGAGDLVWISAMGMFGGLAVLFLVIAYRMTEPSNLAPFDYFGIPSAFVLGWMFFGEAPIKDLYPGALLIIFGGLMIVWRERRLTAMAALTPGLAAELAEARSGDGPSSGGGPSIEPGARR